MGRDGSRVARCYNVEHIACDATSVMGDRDRVNDRCPYQAQFDCFVGVHC